MSNCRINQIMAKMSCKVMGGRVKNLAVSQLKSRLCHWTDHEALVLGIDCSLRLIQMSDLLRQLDHRGFLTSASLLATIHNSSLILSLAQFVLDALSLPRRRASTSHAQHKTYTYITSKAIAFNDYGHPRVYRIHDHPENILLT